MLEDGRSGPARTVVVAEGGPDFLAWAVSVRHQDAELVADEDVAVLGMFSGSWTDAIAARIPTGSTVHVRADEDAAGDSYRAKVRQSLAGRCSLYQAAPRDGRDDNDLLLAGGLPSLTGVELRT
jgi:hypothetical protein